MMENKSHATEIMQKTRLELENGDISDQEIDDAIRVSRQGRNGRNEMQFGFFLFCYKYCSQYKR